MKSTLSILLLLLVAGPPISAQTITKRIVIANGGQFGNPQDDVNITLYNPEIGTYESIDTIRTQSIQDVLIDGRNLYVAAQDSIVKYDLISGTRLAANAFGAPSTISMNLYEDYLLVGNWYAPFGWVGPYNNHFRIFDKHSLAFVDSIPEIHQGVKSFTVLGDTAYLSQNYTSSAFADSAGWMVKVHLPSLSYVDSVKVNENGEDLGRMITLDGIIFGLNSKSNTVTMYDPATGMVMTDTANADLNLGSYGSKANIDQTGILHTIIGGNIGTYDPASRSVIQNNIVDTVVTAFALDTVNQLYYVTQTDFFSYTGGGIYDFNGNRTDTLLSGSAPEAVGVAYNQPPMATNDTLTTLLGLTQETPILANDVDPDGDSLFIQLVSFTQYYLDSLYVENNKLITRGGIGGIGYDTLLYVISDEWGDTDTAVALIFVDTQFGLENQFPAHLITVFPNPVISDLRVQVEDTWKGDMLLLNLEGKTLRRINTLPGEAVTLSMEGLPSGIYLLQGNSPDGFWQKKIVKQ